MISNERKKAMYRKALAALLATTTTLGLAGCGGNEEAPKEDKVEDSANEKQNDAAKSTAYLPMSKMSEEETKKLTAGITISVDELKNMPDECILDDADLAITYCYRNVEKLKDGTENVYYFRTARPRDLLADGTEINNFPDATYFIEFDGIEIVNIEYYDVDDKGEYEKFVEIEEDLYECAGPVLSKEKIAKLNGNQKTLK